MCVYPQPELSLRVLLSGALNRNERARMRPRSPPPARPPLPRMRTYILLLGARVHRAPRARTSFSSPRIASPMGCRREVGRGNSDERAIRTMAIS
jgi:hypothetical protein